MVPIGANVIARGASHASPSSEGGYHDAERATAIVTQVRIYTINRGMLDSWISLFNEKIVPTSAQYGVKVIGAWANRPQNEFIWVRTFDSDDTLKTYESSPERAQYTGQTGSHIAKIEVRTVEDGLKS